MFGGGRGWVLSGDGRPGSFKCASIKSLMERKRDETFLFSLIARKAYCIWLEQFGWRIPTDMQLWELQLRKPWTTKKPNFGIFFCINKLPPTFQSGRPNNSLVPISTPNVPKSTTQWPRSPLEPGPLNLTFNVLFIHPLHVSKDWYSIKFANNNRTVWVFLCGSVKQNRLCEDCRKV